jgi:hypothetical protein
MLAASGPLVVVVTNWIRVPPDGYPLCIAYEGLTVAAFVIFLAGVSAAALIASAFAAKATTPLRRVILVLAAVAVSVLVYWIVLISEPGVGLGSAARSLVPTASSFTADWLIRGEFLGRLLLFWVPGLVAACAALLAKEGRRRRAIAWGVCAFLACAGAISVLAECLDWMHWTDV